MEFLIVLGAGLFLLGLGSVIFFANAKRDQQGEANWPIVAGQIASSALYEHTRRTPRVTERTYTPLIHYCYTVNGMSFTSNRINLLPYTAQSYSEKAAAQAVAAPYEVGKTVPVIYNPRNPSQATLRTHRPIAHRVVLWFGLVNIVLGAMAIGLYFVLPL